MNKFIRYSSFLGSHLLESELAYSTEVYEQEAYVTEKIHGANTSFYIFKNGLVLGSSRNQLLSLNELNTSHIHKGILDVVNVSRLRKIGLSLISNRGFEYVLITGEIFGKGVFNMEYEQVKNKEKDFKIFSVLGVKSRLNNYNILTKMSLTYLRETFTEKELVPIEKVGKYTELLKEYLEPSKLETLSNFGGSREGYVIQPTREITYSTSERYPFEAIKIKGSKFLEVVSNNKVVPFMYKDKTLKLSNSDSIIFTDIVKYITVGRLENVISHGNIEPVIQNVYQLSIEVVLDASSESNILIQEDTKIFSALVKVTLDMVKEYILRG